MNVIAYYIISSTAIGIAIVSIICFCGMDKQIDNLVRKKIKKTFKKIEKDIESEIEQEVQKRLKVKTNKFNKNSSINTSINNISDNTDIIDTHEIENFTQEEQDNVMKYCIKEKADCKFKNNCTNNNCHTCMNNEVKDYYAPTPFITKKGTFKCPQCDNDEFVGDKVYVLINGCYSIKYTCTKCQHSFYQPISTFIRG